MSELDDLMLRAERLEAAQECRNLMGRYSYLHTASRNVEFMELWSKREDVSQTMPFGRFFGYDGVYQSYVGFHGDRNNPEDCEELRGMMMMHEMGTDVIEVAADGKTAKGIWISPGHETSPEPAKSKGAWCWGKYEVEFIREDGAWKFWHMTLYPLFLTPYDRSWGEPALKMAGNGAMPEIGDFCHPLEKPFWSFGSGQPYPADEPAVPEPYDSYPGID